MEQCRRLICLSYFFAYDCCYLYCHCYVKRLHSHCLEVYLYHQRQCIYLRPDSDMHRHFCYSDGIRQWYFICMEHRRHLSRSDSVAYYCYYLYGHRYYVRLYSYSLSVGERAEHTCSWYQRSQLYLCWQ